MTIKTSLIINAKADTKAIRMETLQDEEHMIVPVIALVEGVHQAANASNPELALAEEFGKFPQSWNGRPILLNHPVRDGELVSANRTDVVNDDVFGNLYNAFIEDKSLKAEIWINTARVAEMGEDVQSTVKRLKDGDLVEVSIGAFMSILDAKGTYGGKAYEGIWIDVVPDHMALLSEGTIGACSIEDGCGAPRINMRSSDTEQGAPPSSSGPTNVAKSKKKSIFTELVEKFKALKLNLGGSDDDISDADKRRRLDAALSDADPERAFIWIVAVFNSSVVYERNETLLMRSYAVDNAGNVSVEDDIIAVFVKTTFEPVEPSPQGASTMTDLEKRVAALIANPKTQFIESNAAILNGLSENAIKEMEDAAEKLPEQKQKEPETKQKESEPAAASSTTQATLPTSTSITPQEAVKEEAVKLLGGTNAKTAEEFIDEAPSEMQEVLLEGLSMHRGRKAELVKNLAANTRCDYSEKELATMSVKNLEKLAKLADIPTYQGVAPILNPATFEDNTVPEPPKMFAKPN